MKRAGRPDPGYTKQQLARVRCVRYPVCGSMANQQWTVCADGLWRPVCIACDIAVNRAILTFMLDAGVEPKMAAYEKALRK